MLLTIVQPIWRSDDAWSPVGGRLIDAPAGIAAAIERLAAVRPGLRVVNAQRWGSWLELRAPGARYFADSRIELIPVVAWADYLDASSAAPGWPSILERWHVEAVAVSVIDQGPLMAALEADPGWRRIYADADGELFVRSPRPGHWPSLLAMPAVPTAAARPVIVLGPSTGWGES